MKGSAPATLGGLLAIVLWSTTVAIARSLSEQLGPLTAGASVYGLCGLVSGARLFLTRGGLLAILRLPGKYLFGCGALFIFYMFGLFAAIGLSSDRVQVLEIGLLNYLWPPLTLLFSLVLLHRRAGWILVPGTGLALAGIFLVLAREGGFTWESFLGNLSDNPAAYALGLGAAVSWALYSNLARRWAGGHPKGAVDLFIPATGVVLIALALAVEPTPEWTLRAVLETVFFGLATYAAYSLWDFAMRQGEVVLVAACSYLTPLLSTLVSVFYLEVSPTRGLWTGCLLLVAGSFLSWISVEGQDPAKIRLRPRRKP